MALARVRLIRLSRLALRLFAAVSAPFVWVLMVAWAVLGRSGQRVRRVIQVRERPPAGRNRVCLYSHFDRDSLLAPHVLQALAAVSRLGFRIHFITTSRHLHPGVIEAVSPYCDRLIHKDNHGLDFGAWRLGWRLLDREGLDELLLLNDSVYGPLTDLTPIFARMDGEACDFWGITDSWDKKYHLQSYFLVIRRQLLASRVFDRFWDSFWLVNHKGYIVNRCEIGLTQRFLKAGFRPKALCSYLDVRAGAVNRLREGAGPDSQDGAPHRRSFWDPARRLSEEALVNATLNPMHHFWQDLITDFGCPFLKADLLVRNPVEIPDAYQWKQLVAEQTAYDPGLIESHLYRMAEKRVP